MGLKVLGRLVRAGTLKTWYFPVFTFRFMFGNELFLSIFFDTSIFLKLTGDWQLQILDKLR